ncbi:hypothetical protein OHR68_12005 [Spirillospora sp. NBC_00431]
MLSRHLTSEGVVSYTRCACGEVQVRVRRFEPGTMVTGGPGGGSPSDAS